jgi:hypothetical protein
MNTISFTTQSVIASEVLNTIFPRMIRNHKEVLDGMDFSAYDIESYDALFLDVLDFYGWLENHSTQELTLRIYKDGICELVGDMGDEKDVVMATDTTIHGTLSDLVIL